MKKTPAVNVLAVGVGGQGIIRLSDILAEVAFRAGADVKKSEIHGLSQRGGSVTSHIRWGEHIHTPVIMDGEADFIVALEELEALRHAHVLKPEGTIVVNDYRLLPATVVLGVSPYPDDVDASLGQYGTVERVGALEVAQGLGEPRAANVVLLGALSRHLEIPIECWTETIRGAFKEKVIEVNLKAFEAGRQLSTEGR
jgi:indolepyruvate ferredoxin oxidoreductase beta subunit